MAKKNNVGSREVEPFQVRDPRPVLSDDALYLGDGGRVTCGKHAGNSARYSGRGLSGKRVVRVTEADRAEWLREIGEPIACEDCRPIVADAEGQESEAPHPATLVDEWLGGDLVLFQRYRVDDPRTVSEICADAERRAYWPNGLRVTEDQIERIPGGETLRAICQRERLTVLRFATEADAERTIESEVQP